jgi:hypothetical protein
MLKRSWRSPKSLFRDIELHSEILPALWQGGTEDDDNIYHGQKRLPTLSDPRPFDAVVSLCAYTQPVGWLVKDFRYTFPDGSVRPKIRSGQN